LIYRKKNEEKIFIEKDWPVYIYDDYIESTTPENKN
jgi:hypothetical protein